MQQNFTELELAIIEALKRHKISANSIYQTVNYLHPHLTVDLEAATTILESLEERGIVYRIDTETERDGYKYKIDFRHPHFALRNDP